MLQFCVAMTWSNILKNLYLLSKIYCLLGILVLNMLVTSCGQKGDLVRPVIEEEKPPQQEELKSL